MRRIPFITGLTVHHVFVKIKTGKDTDIGDTGGYEDKLTCINAQINNLALRRHCVMNTKTRKHSVDM